MSTMIMFAIMQIPSHVSTKSIHPHDNWKNVVGNMCLLAQNMEPHILNNGGEKNLNYIMCGLVHTLS